MCSLKDDDSISSALGYVAHVLVLLSKYLQVPQSFILPYDNFYRSHFDMKLFTMHLGQ